MDHKNIMDHKKAHNIAKYFNNIHTAQVDPWGFWESNYEQIKYNQQIQLVKHIVNPKNILEIGCSTGAHTDVIAKAFPNASIVALDISQSAILNAKKKIKNKKYITFIASDIFQYLKNSDRNTYDAIFWSEGFDEIHQFYTFADFISLIKALHEAILNKGILCVSHITAKNKSKSKLNTPHEALESYHSIIGAHFIKTMEAIYQGYKVESQSLYQYGIYLYRPKTKFDKPICIKVPKINKIDIVIPARDESETIADVILEMKRSKYTNKIIVVDNNSADSTSKQAKAAGAHVVNCQQRGYGISVKNGINSSEETWVVKLDADIENPNFLWVDEMVDYSYSNNIAFVKTFWKATIEDPDRVTNFTAKPALKILFPELYYLKSPLSGIYLLDKSKVNLDILPNDFAFDIALLLQIHANQYNIGQIEIDSVKHASVSNAKRTLEHYFRMSEMILQYIITESYEKF